MTPISSFARKRLLSFPFPRRYSSSVASLPTLHIPKGTHVFQYGNATGGKKGQAVRPLLELKEKGWKIEGNEKWAVIGGGKERKVLLDVSVSLWHRELQEEGRTEMKKELELTSSSFLPSLLDRTAPPHPPSSIATYTATWSTPFPLLCSSHRRLHLFHTSQTGRLAPLSLSLSPLSPSGSDPPSHLLPPSLPNRRVLGLHSSLWGSLRRGPQHPTPNHQMDPRS